MPEVVHRWFVPEHVLDPETLGLVSQLGEPFFVEMDLHREELPLPAEHQAAEVADRQPDDAHLPLGLGLVAQRCRAGAMAGRVDRAVRPVLIVPGGLALDQRAGPPLARLAREPVRSDP